MCLFRFGLVLPLLMIAAPGVPADEPPDPLRLVPDQADLFFQVPQPRRLAETILGIPAAKQLQQFDTVRELYESTNARRARQFVAYYEKALGLPWPQLLDRLAGGGIVAAVKFGPDPPLVLLVAQSKDEALLKRFSELGLKILEQELVRQESKEHVVRTSYHGVQTLSLGKDFHAAIAGGALLISNSTLALHLALDQCAKGGSKSLAHVADVAAARTLVPADPLAWLWFNTRVAHTAPQAKEIFTLPRNDVNLTVAVGALLDVLGRSPYACASLSQKGNALFLRARLPRGRDGMSPALTIQAPAGGQPQLLPLLEPPGVIYSSSSYFDLGKFWENRKQLFNAKQVKTFEQFDQTTGKFLLGHRFSQLTNQMGPYLRFVVANVHERGYQRVPATRLPAFGLVTSMREPAFGKAMDGVIRAGALLAGFQVKLKLVNEMHNGYKLVGYRFAEDAPLPPNIGDVVFNFTPCFVTVGDQFAICSTLELGRQLIPILEKEKKRAPKGSPVIGRTQVYGKGAAELVGMDRERLLAQTILSQALPPDQAGQQVRDLIDWVRGLGVLRLTAVLGRQQFGYDLEFRPEQNTKLTQKRPEVKSAAGD